MAGMKDKGAEQVQSPVTGSSKAQVGPDKNPDGSKENMEGEGALCEDTSVTHPGKSDDPDNKDKPDDPHTRSKENMEGEGALSEDTSATPPVKSDVPDIKDKPDDPNTSLRVIKRNHTSSTETIYQYRSPDSSSHRLVDNEQTPGVSPAKEERSFQRSSSAKDCQPTGSRAGGLLAFCSSVCWGSAVRLLSILMFLSVLVLTFYCCYRSEDPVVIPELRVMMLGKTGSGKSASGNTILAREAFKSKASALPVTKSCDIQSGVVEGRNITVIDTPAITTRKASWLSEKVDAGPHVFLLVITLHRFTKEHGQEVKWIQSNIGEEALKFTIVLFTGGDQMDHKNILQFLNESSGLQTLVSSTGGGYHIFDNKTPRGRGQVKGLLEKIEQLLIKNTGYSYSYGLHEQVKTAVREEEERKRLNQEQGQNMEKRIEQKIMEQMELKMMTRIVNATATLDEIKEVVKASTEQRGNCILEQVKAAEREEEERKRREEEDKRERLKTEREIHEMIKTMEKRIELTIMEQMELKMKSRIANATAILNELREVIKSTTEQSVNSVQEQVKAAEREEEERKRREEERMIGEKEEKRESRKEEDEEERKIRENERREKEEERREKEEEEKVEFTTEQGGNSMQEQVTTTEREEEATTDQGENFLIYLFVAVSGLIVFGLLVFVLIRIIGHAYEEH